MFRRPLCDGGRRRGRDGLGGGKFHDGTREARALPGRAASPCREFFEKDADDFGGVVDVGIKPVLEPGEGEFVLRIEHGGEERVFAREVIVEGAFGNAGGFGDHVQTGAVETFFVEDAVGGIDDALFRVAWRAGHVYPQVSLQGGADGG